MIAHFHYRVIYYYSLQSYRQDTKIQRNKIYFQVEKKKSYPSLRSG